jgi:YD repeat-containing protein
MSARRRRSRRPELLIAAALLLSAVVFGLGVALGARSTGTNTANTPNSSPGTAAPNPTTAGARPDPAPGEMPPTVVVVSAGRLSAIDTASGTRTQLAAPGVGPFAATATISSPTIDATSAVVYFSAQAANTTPSVWRVGTVGGPVVRVAPGLEPAVSPDGRWLASVVDGAVVLTDLTDESATTRSPTGNQRFAKPVWSPEGDALLVELGGSLVVFPRSADGSLGTATTIATADRMLHSPSWRSSDGAIVALRDTPPGGVVLDQTGAEAAVFALETTASASDYDASGELFGYLLTTGTLRWQGRNASGQLAAAVDGFAW